MQRSQQGWFERQTVGGEPFATFIPHPLPPVPELELGGERGRTLSRADQMVGRLDGISRILPNPAILIDFYIRKEAVLSSQIEGTQSTLTDLLLFELQPETGDEDTLEVSNYVAALRHGLGRLHSGVTLGLQLIREMHEILLQSGRGSNSTPGEFRTSQNWIGGSRPGNALYVPPPVSELYAVLGDLERFLNQGADQYPVLVQCALVHVQFETIHPFLDGNGRIGRLLITLLLVERGVLRQPMLYLSLYLKQHRDEYYSLLQRVRKEGIWEEWIDFFIQGTTSTAEKAVRLAEAILDRFQRDEAAVLNSGSRKGSALQVLQQMQKTPYISPSRLAQKTGLSFNTVAAALDTLEELSLVVEMSPRPGRLVSYFPYLRLLEEGTVAI